MLFEVQLENKINDEETSEMTTFHEYLEPKMTKLRFKNNKFHYTI